MSAYHQAGFTVDPLHPIDENPQAAVGVDEYGFGEELAGRSADYAATVAGPLGLSAEDSALTLTVTVAGADDASRVVIDWGDGEVTQDQTTASHTYRMAGTYTVAAHATIDGRDYAIAKTRLMADAPL